MKSRFFVAFYSGALASSAKSCRFRADADHFRLCTADRLNNCHASPQFTRFWEAAKQGTNTGGGSFLEGSRRPNQSQFHVLVYHEAVPELTLKPP